MRINGKTGGVEENITFVGAFAKVREASISFIMCVSME
jgi:hypothetical protein